MREILIDWFQFTIKFDDSYYKDLNLAQCNDINEFICKHIFEFLFGISRDLIVNEFSPKNGYTRCYNYKNIQVMCSDKTDAMGFNVLLSGQGCRDYESLGLTWLDLFEKIILVGTYNINRIDIAIDSINTNDYTIDLLYSYLEKCQVSTKFRTCLNINSFKTANYESTGRNLQFGSKASNTEITFYDKKNERLSAGYEVDVDSWYRCELRFRSENAKDFFIELVNDFNLNKVFSILYNYIDFKEYSEEDSNKSRWPTAQFWLDFVQNANKYRFVTRKAEDSIEKKKEWLSNSCSRSDAMVVLATIPSLKEKIDYHTKWVLGNGSDRLNDLDLKKVNEFRISNGDLPFTKSEYIAFIKEQVEMNRK